MSDSVMTSIVMESFDLTNTTHNNNQEQQPATAKIDNNINWTDNATWMTTPT